MKVKINVSFKFVSYEKYLWSGFVFVVWFIVFEIGVVFK